jgi:hypothetical protein
MARISERTGTRVYVQTRYGEPVVGKLKDLGAHWDRDRKEWWIGAAKAAQVEALLREEGAGFDLRDPVDRAARADQLEDAGRGAEAEHVRSGEVPQEDPDNIRLTGKGEYKGRSYYVGASTRDGKRCRLLALPDAGGKYLDFWADANLVTITKRYESRQVWDGRRYSGRTVTKYTTLGSIAKFLRDQKDPATRRGQCTECGSWGPAGESCGECGGEGSYV